MDANIVTHWIPRGMDRSYPGFAGVTAKFQGSLFNGLRIAVDKTREII